MNNLPFSRSIVCFAISSNVGASCTISLVIPVIDCIDPGIDVSGLMSVLHSRTPSSSTSTMPISVIRSNGAVQPVVSRSTKASGCMVCSFSHERRVIRQLLCNEIYPKYSHAIAPRTVIDCDCDGSAWCRLATVFQQAPNNNKQPPSAILRMDCQPDRNAYVQTQALQQRPFGKQHQQREPIRRTSSHSARLLWQAR